MPQYTDPTYGVELFKAIWPVTFTLFSFVESTGDSIGTGTSSFNTSVIDTMHWQISNGGSIIHVPIDPNIGHNNGTFLQKVVGNANIVNYGGVQMIAIGML